MNNDTTVQVKIVATDESKAAVEQANSGFKNLWAQVGGGFLAAQLAQAGIEKLKGAFDEVKNTAKEWQNQQAALNAALTSTHDASGLSSQDAVDYADALSKITPITREAVLAGENMLLTFKNIHKDVFPQTTKAIADMATAMNHGLTPDAQTLSNTAIMVGKALNDPEHGLTRLMRVGVMFTQQQKDQIKAMQDAGNVTGAQTLILNELSNEFGGRASAAAQTFQGRVQMLKNQMTDWGVNALQKSTVYLNQLYTSLIPIANFLANIFTPAFVSLSKTIRNDLMPVLDMHKKGLEELAKVFIVVASVPFAIMLAIIYASVKAWTVLVKVISVVIDIFGGLANAFEKVYGSVKQVFSLFNDLFTGGDPTLGADHATKGWVAVDKVFVQVRETFIRVINDISKAWDRTWGDIKHAFVDVVHAIGLVLTPLAVVYGFIFKTMYALALWVWHGIYNDAVAPAINAITQAFQAMWNFAKSIWNSLYIDIIKPVFTLIETAAMNDWHTINAIWQAIYDFAKPIWSAIGNFGVGAWHTIVAAWQSAESWFKSLFNGVSDAGGSAAHSLTGFFSQIWKDVKNDAKDALNFVIGILDDVVKAYNTTVGKVPGAPKMGTIPKFASGVSNFSGGWAITGEQGPELSYHPPGTTILPASQTSNIMNRNSSNTFNVNLNTAAATREFFTQIDRDNLLAGKGLSQARGVSSGY